MAELGQVNIRRAYGNFAKDNLSRWDKITNKFGIPHSSSSTFPRASTATDMAMTIDADRAAIVSGQGRHGYGIMTSAAISRPLVTRLVRTGILVYGRRKTDPEHFSGLHPVSYIDELNAARGTRHQRQSWSPRRKWPTSTI